MFTQLTTNDADFGASNRLEWTCLSFGIRMTQRSRDKNDHVAVTWADPLVPPPISLWEEGPVIWAGKGPNPDATPPASPTASVPTTVRTAAKSEKRQRTPEVNPTKRVRKLSTESSKVNKNTRKSLADKVDAGISGLEDQVRELPLVIHATGSPSQIKTAVTASDAKQTSITEDGGSAPTKRPRGRPASKAKLAANDSKRPRGRPPGKRKSEVAKAKEGSQCQRRRKGHEIPETETATLSTLYS